MAFQAYPRYIHLIKIEILNNILTFDFAAYNARKMKNEKYPEPDQPIRLYIIYISSKLKYTK